MTWEIHETDSRELHVRRPHQPDQIPAGRITTYGLRRPSFTYGFDVVAVIMPRYIRRKGKAGYGVTADFDEVECDAVPNWDLATTVLNAMKALP